MASPRSTTLSVRLEPGDLADLERVRQVVRELMPGRRVSKGAAVRYAIYKTAQRKEESTS